MKDFFKYIPVTTIIVSLLFISGGLYLAGYWSTFDIDAFSFLQIWDIPKSFIMPFIISNVIILISVGIYILFTSRSPFVQITNKNLQKFVNWCNSSSVSTIMFLITIIIFLFIYPFNKYSIGFWYSGGYIISTFIIYEIFKYSFIIRLIPDKRIRLIILMILIYIPFTCLTLGKTKALDIYLNKDFRYISIRTAINNKTIVDSASSFKLLGFLGDKFIISDLYNKKTFILNQKDFQIIELGEKWVFEGK